MRRLLTGYAVSFNHRHHRHGQLFQNRYKSILCEEDSYLLELTRYIHLNPLRAGVVSDIKSLDVYPFSGHAVLMANRSVEWQTTEPILRMFHARERTARSKYLNFVMEGIAAGKRPELVGGGLIRSAGGWKAARDNFKGEMRIKGDERILGSGEFVEAILKESREQLEHRYKLQSQGIGIQQLAHQIAERHDIEPYQLMSCAKYTQIVQARSLLCYLAVRELGMTATALAKSLGMTQPAVSISVKRGELIVKEQDIQIDDFIKL